MKSVRLPAITGLSKCEHLKHEPMSPITHSALIGLHHQSALMLTLPKLARNAHLMPLLYGRPHCSS